MAHFYLVDSLETPVLVGEEARHAATVARIRVGEATTVGDGRGAVAAATVESVERDRVVLRLGAVTAVPRPSPRIVLVQALAKGGRDELAIQAATELGVDAVIPWEAERSVPHWSGEKARRGGERWAGIVREAGKQAMRPWSVEVLPLAATTDVAALGASALLVVLDPAAEARLLEVVPPTFAGDLVLVVGPEGGVARAELERLVAAGAATARLGAEVLRTSTAGPAALAALAPHLGRW